MKFTPRTLKLGMRAWPPFLGAGISVRHIADDWSRAEVTLRVNSLTRNALGTAFGGSLSSMTDPFYVLLLMPQLGEDYYVWDASAEIDFVKRGRGKLTAVMHVPASTVEDIRARAASGDRTLTWFECDITDESGDVVAHVRRQVYVRLQPHARKSNAETAMSVISH
ncbi:DUF4442 domain-containing protein [Hoyosella rhizosphaerae]|uniref:DUF4442 domain-containing protein n=1 Tax=Hoyosella rhizosphaerae TaxID=1755582 RepID=A0A916X8M2_9ACTN|nr:DUF4442 domain-containing protein [Hoyosella rhizosphaerae]MBN4927011.1 DUF4442 domain-containing protein [Hoyosella rhizosphaerae]GGC54731.1 DUF4442 domain-containing protein [Hoyosella rhizosphaerae]